MGEADGERVRVTGRLNAPCYPVYWRCPKCCEINVLWSDWHDVTMLLNGARGHGKCEVCGQRVAVGDLEVPSYGFDSDSNTNDSW